MTDTEFLSLLPEGAKKPTDKEFETINFVNNYHPSINPGYGKEQIAMLYSTFGMRIIMDMLGTAKKAEEIDDERMRLKRRLKELEMEDELLAML